MKIQQIRRNTADYFMIRPRDMDTASREHKYVLPRQIAHYLCIRIFCVDATLGQIAQKIGHRDHATALNSCKAVENMLATGYAYKGRFIKNIINDIIARCNTESRLTIRAKALSVMDYSHGKHVNLKALVLNGSSIKI